MGWISVESRLPDYGVPVRVTDSLGWFEAVWSLDWDDAGDFWRDDVGWGHDLDDVAFWRPCGGFST